MINKTTKGDLIEKAMLGDYDAIVHGCNCFIAMGKGIAFSIRREFPEAYIMDKKTKKGDKSKLGSFTFATVIRFDNIFDVVNAYTQYDYRNKRDVDYDAIRSVFEKINNQYSGKKVGIPLIGAGLAGGDWDVIKDIIDNATPDVDIELVLFQK